MDRDERERCLRNGSVPRDFPSGVAADWPDVLAIVEARVKPGRKSLSNSAIDRAHRKRWWLYANARPELTAAIAGLIRVLVVARVGQYASFAFLPAGMVCSEQVVIFPFSSNSAFCTLQSRVHEIWARFFGSSHEGRSPLHSVGLLRDLSVSPKLGEASSPLKPPAPHTMSTARRSWWRTTRA